MIYSIAVNLLPINTCVGMFCIAMKQFSQIRLFGGSINYCHATMVTEGKKQPGTHKCLLFSLIMEGTLVQVLLNVIKNVEKWSPLSPNGVVFTVWPSVQYAFASFSKNLLTFL